MSFETDLQNDPKGLAKQYAFLPADRASGFLFGSHAAETALTGNFAGFRHSIVNNDKRIARVKLELSHNGSRGEALQVKPTLNGTDGVPVYFLPWDERGAAVGMEIPNADPNLPEDKHPKLFFTAVLSGCMIAFKGTQQKPVVYHCGTAGGNVGTDTGGTDSNTFFNDLLEQARRQGLSPGVSQAKIKSTDYMVTKAGTGTVALEQQLITDLKAHWANPPLIKYVKTWGVCFGVRTGTDWKFYQQENASIFYFRFWDAYENMQYDVKRWYGTKTKTATGLTRKSEFLQVAKPLSVKRVFPGGGATKITNSWHSLAV